MDAAPQRGLAERLLARLTHRPVPAAARGLAPSLRHQTPPQARCVRSRRTLWAVPIQSAFALNLQVGDSVQVSPGQFERIVALTRDDDRERLTVGYATGGTNTLGFGDCVVIDNDPANKL